MSSMSKLITFSNVHKKLRGLQVARQYELDKSKVLQKKLKEIEEFILNYYMHPYSKEVIEIKLKVIEVINDEKR